MSFSRQLRQIRLRKVIQYCICCCDSTLKKKKFVCCCQLRFSFGASSSSATLKKTMKKLIHQQLFNNSHEGINFSASRRETVWLSVMSTTSLSCGATVDQVDILSWRDIKSAVLIASVTPKRVPLEVFSLFSSDVSFLQQYNLKLIIIQLHEI